MENRKAMDLSLLRRLFHLCGAIMPVTYLLFGRSAALLVTVAIIVLITSAEIVRIGLSLDSRFLRKHLKERELKKPTGSLFYAVSCLLVILLCDKNTAVASIFVLVLCDPLSTIVGSRWGGRRVLGKTAQGTLTFFVSSIVVLSRFPFTIPALLAASVAATAAEFFSSRFIDDNFTIPLVTALVLSMFTL